MSLSDAGFTRRGAIAAAVSAGTLALVSCGPSGGVPATEAQNRSRPPVSKPQLAAMTVYRDPSCGCCEAWAEIARNAGYEVTLIDRSDMAAIKRQHGVPESLASCHTALVGGYAIEGHVPLGAVARLLRERPGGLKGIAVPGMPRGSPGMEMPDGSADPFEVVAFDASGMAGVFSASRR